MQKLAFVNQKGGVGKTTSTFNIGAVLADRGHKVLFVDLDPSANLTYSTGHKDDFEYSLFDFMAKDNLLLHDVIVHDERGFDLIPSERKLEKANIALASEVNMNMYLRKKINESLSPDSYDYVLFDCAPTLGLLTTNAMCATDHLVVVQQLQGLALEGMKEIIAHYGRVREVHADLNFLGIIATFFDQRENSPKEILAELKEKFSKHMFDTVIRKNVRVSESVQESQSVIEFAPKSYGAEDYTNVTNEIISRIQKPVKA